MKFLNKIKVACLFAIIFCLCFSACAKKTGNIDDIFSQLEISDAETETEIPAFTEHIYIIIPSGASGELAIKARELADKIEAKTEILTSLKYDNELTVVPRNSCEVLIGNTNRLASENALDVLRTDEYLCRWDDGAIVICGRNDGATQIAIDRFINEILPLSSKYSLMQSDAKFEFYCDYAVESVKLNGYDLYDYVLTYAKSNKNQEKTMAFALRDYINSKSGYLLEVLADDEITSKDGRFISLQGASKENALALNEKGIALQGVNSYMLSLAVMRFINDFEANINSNLIELNYYEKISIEDTKTSFQTSVCFVKDNSTEPFEPIYNLLGVLRAEDMGVCFIANPNDAMREDFSFNIKEPIKLNEVLIGEREILVAYNEQNLKQINITVDENNLFVKAEIETLCGEKIYFIYIIDSEYVINSDLITENCAVFCENPSKTEYSENEGIPFFKSGSFSISDNEMGYLYVSGENVMASQCKVNDDKNGFSCIIDNNFIYSSEFLNYTLK